MNAMNYIGLDIQEEHQLKGGERFTIWSEFDLLVEPGCNAGKGFFRKYTLLPVSISSRIVASGNQRQR